ncbi:MAG: type II toxin-antitoxin system RelB/DinJ family antitoxin [Firmicutes bacterium]|nr:type II toxin-antitoxin system RelB/DinJ family antitoxin [Bacillota bacterium]MBR3395550.1 type II toxin-antitoxin system RelB/DinJ family antitoxin [Bacillota bacterium]
MATVLQVRLDDELKAQATMVYDQLGLDLSSAVRMFLKKSVAVNGIPFEVRNESSRSKAEAALLSMRVAAEENGLSDLTLDEINEIIQKAREARKQSE